ncbi:hypothetical protein BH11PAT1_BH11PAT1_6510 [soil metagenome]
MNIAAFILFGLINGLIINSLEPDGKKGSYLGAILMGMLGAITGGMFAFMIFGGVSIITFNPSLMMILLIEGVLLSFLVFGKAFKRV